MTIARRHWLARSATAATLACCLAAGLCGTAFAQAGKALNIALFPEPPSILAGWGNTGPAQMVNGNIYDSLLRYDEKLQPLPSLATEWTVSKDSLTYTFKLKKGVTWHDGKPFSADDVVYTADVFMRALNPRVRVALLSIKSIKALDSQTVEFQLSHPYAPFLGMFDTSTMPIVPKHLFEKVDLSKPPAGLTPVGTGPYKFKAWERGSFIQLEKHATYHMAGLPKVDNVYFHVIPDAASRAAAFESGKVDVLPGGTVEYFDVPRLAKLPGVTVTTKGWEKFAPLSWLWMNHRQPLFQDVRVRQAVMHALNRDAIAKVVWQGYAKPATGPWNRLTPFYTDKTKAYPHDPAKAKKLLAEAGYKGQPVRLLGLPFGETWARMAEMMKQQLIQGGFNIELVSADLPGVMKRQATWDFDLATTFIYQYGDPALGISRNYIGSEIKQGSPFNNVGGYQNPKVDALFERASRESDNAKRGQMYADIQNTLVDDAAEGWLLDLNFPTVYRSSIDNLVNSSLGLNDSLARASFK